MVSKQVLSIPWLPLWACALDLSWVSAVLSRGRKKPLRGQVLQMNKALPTASSLRQRDFYYYDPYRLPKAVGTRRFSER